MLPICRSMSSWSRLPIPRGRLAFDLSLYLVANRPSFQDETLFFSKIMSAVKGGVSCVQFRDHKNNSSETIRTVLRLKNMLKGVPLFINTLQSFDVIHAVDAEGIYLEDNFPYLEARKLLGKKVVIGAAVKTMEEVLALGQRSEVDYVSVKISPSKKTCPRNDQLWGMEGLRNVRAIIPHRIVAIGGLNLSCIEPVYRELRLDDGIAMAGGGIGRGISVHSLIYPLEVIKIRQQCSQAESKSIRIAMALLRQEGIDAFYKGLAPQLLKTSIKQVWCWPMIIALPTVLQRYQIENLGQQAITGLTIATIDAAISTPLERVKILSAFRGTSKFCFQNAYRDRWRGFATYWSKLSVNWIAFLTAQKYLRDQSSRDSKDPLSFPQLTKIGIEVALIVSLVSAPFDIANTLKQAQNLTPVHLFSRHGVFKLYRGWPLNALSLVIHNIASVTLIEKLANL